MASQSEYAVDRRIEVAANWVYKTPHSSAWEPDSENDNHVYSLTGKSAVEDHLHRRAAPEFTFAFISTRHLQYMEIRLKSAFSGADAPPF